jgi:hypothetical protein
MTTTDAMREIAPIVRIEAEDPPDSDTASTSLFSRSSAMP